MGVLRSTAILKFKTMTTIAAITLLRPLHNIMIDTANIMILLNVLTIVFALSSREITPRAGETDHRACFSFRAPP